MENIKVGDVIRIIPNRDLVGIRDDWDEAKILSSGPMIVTKIHDHGLYYTRSLRWPEQSVREEWFFYRHEIEKDHFTEQVMKARRG